MYMCVHVNAKETLDIIPQMSSALSLRQEDSLTWNSTSRLDGILICRNPLVYASPALGV